MPVNESYVNLVQNTDSSLGRHDLELIVYLFVFRQRASTFALNLEMIEILAYHIFQTNRGWGDLVSA